MKVDIRVDMQAVFLVPYGDGKRIDYAIAADEEARTIWRYKTNENGRVKHPIETETQTFDKVKLFFGSSTTGLQRKKLRIRFHRNFKLEPVVKHSVDTRGGRI